MFSWGGGGILVNTCKGCSALSARGVVNEKVCSVSMSAATSHSAHLYHLPLPFSFCWQIKIHGLPSHPFSLRCLIVSKIEITGRNFCTNKNLSGTWQCVTWHTHTCASGIPLRIAGGIPQNPNLLSFLFPPPGSSCWVIKKCATEGRTML